jgi:hypothetical protein
MAFHPLRESANMTSRSRKQSRKWAERVDEAFDRVEAAAALLASAAALLWVVYDMGDEIRREWRQLRGRPRRRLKRTTIPAAVVVAPAPSDRHRHN